MGYKFNPFTGTLDDVGAGGGGSTSPGGSDTQVQFNDGGAFAGDADLTWNKTTNVLGVTGDVNLSDGGTYTTTLQTITPTAARTISFPDATGTVALVAGSSGQLVYNNAGAQAGAPGSVVGATGDITLGLNGAASTPPLDITGTWFTGGTATTTKPQVLIEPTGATSTAWSTSGTGFGVNAASGFAGNLLDLQVNGTSKLRYVNSETSLAGQAGKEAIYSSLINVRNFYGSAFILNGAGVSNGLKIGAGAGGYLDITGGDLGVSFNFPNGQAYLSTDAAGTLAQRNGTNAQTFRLYNTYTSATSYERAKLEWSSNVFRIGTEKGSGGGTARALEFQTDGTTRWTISASSGSLQAGTNAGVYVENGGVGRINYSSISFPTVDGNILLDNWNGNGFDRLQFGGTTSSFPSIKRNSAEFQARLADDSGYTTVDAQHRLQGTAPASATATGTAGDIRYDADYIYICTATNTWKRSAIATW
jgi:hypothetical protein